MAWNWKAANEKLDEIEALPSSWDSYQARRIGENAIVAVRSFLRQIESWAPAPFIAPVATGAVQLEWEPHGLCYLELCFDGETIQCSAVNLDCPWRDVSPWTPAEVETDWMGRGQALDLVKWIAREAADQPRPLSLRLLAHLETPVSAALATAGLLPLARVELRIPPPEE